MTGPLLHLEGIGLSFRTGAWWRPQRLRALHDVGFTLDRGEITALIGESGSGKSTLARVLVRLLEPDQGRFTLDGVDVRAAEPRGPGLGYRRRVQLVFQDPYAAFNPVSPIGTSVARALVLHGHATPATLAEPLAAAFRRVGLEPGLAARLPHELSGGQRQRVALARALAVRPDLLIADEPTAMLDVSSRAEILDHLSQDAATAGRAVLLVTHDLASAWRVAHRAVVLYAGQVMEDGPANQVLARPRHPYARLLVAAARRDTDLRAPLPARAGRPTLVDPPPGCPFAARCPHATERCRRDDPPVVAVGPRHSFRCHLDPGALA